MRRRIARPGVSYTGNTQEVVGACSRNRYAGEEAASRETLRRVCARYPTPDHGAPAPMTLRESFTDALKTSMRAGDAPRTSTLRMIMAKVKDIDIAARPKGITAVPDDDIIAALRGMIKSRREAVELYRQGNRPELADKEEAEIAVIESFLPAQMGADALVNAVDAAIAETGATGVKDTGKVMAALKAKYGAALDMAKAGALAKTRLK